MWTLVTGWTSRLLAQKRTYACLNHIHTYTHTHFLVDGDHDLGFWFCLPIILLDLLIWLYVNEDRMDWKNKMNGDDSFQDFGA